MVEGNLTEPRKVRKRAEREDRILKAAEELIFANGFANTTIDDIAARADVSKGAVYLHYRTKDDIYFSVASRALEIMQQMFQEAVVPHKTGLERFRAIGYAFYDYTKRYPEYSGMLYDVNSPKPCHGLASERRCHSLTEQIGMIMVSSIEQGIQDGSVRPDTDPAAAALIISSSLQGLLRTILGESEMMRQRGWEEKRLIDYAIDLYGRSLMNPAVTGDGCGQTMPPAKTTVRKSPRARHS
jgi:TetR/AcrR family transcriptional regulator